MADRKTDRPDTTGLDPHDLEWLNGDEHHQHEPARDDGRVEKIGHHVAEIMKILDLDLDDDNLKDTPTRVAKMYLELFRSLDLSEGPRVTVFDNEEGYSSMVTVKDIPFYSMCAHHFVPFFGLAHVAYLPDRKIVGLSKIARVVKHYARMPQIQERMTGQIADYLNDQLAPEGVYVYLEARHLCMEMRGIESHGGKTVTSEFRGCFAKHEVRQEFLDLLKIAKWEGH
jgi:GTP cyclohydrolase IA